VERGRQKVHCLQGEVSKREPMIAEVPGWIPQPGVGWRCSILNNITKVEGVNIQWGKRWDVPGY